MIFLKAAPILLVAVAQAVTISSFIPFAPNLIAIFPAAIFPIVIGINIGETLEAPFSFILVTCCCIVPSPPTPEPKITPTLEASSFSISIPLSSIA